MKYVFLVFCVSLVICANKYAFSADNDTISVIQSIRYLGKKNGAEIIRVKLSHKTAPAFFTLPGERPRLVFDFMSVGYARGLERSISIDGVVVKRIRIGTHLQPALKTRVVVDMKKDINYKVDQVYMDDQTALDIVISPPKTEESIQRQGDSPSVVATISEAKKQIEQVSTSSKKDQIAQAAKVPIVKVEEAVTKPSIIPEKKTAESSAGSSAQTGKESQFLTLKESTDVQETIDVAEVAVLLDINFERSTNDKEMVLFKLSGFHPPVVFSTEGQELFVVCDFLDAALAYGVDDHIITEGKYIDTIKVTTHDDPIKVRVTMELQGKFNYDLKQVFFKEDNLFVIIISNLGDKK